MSQVLIVEDDWETREILRRVLEAEGFGAIGAANGQEALALLGCMATPSLVLLDLSLPELNGWEVLRLLRADASLAHVPVVVTTACPEMEADGAQLVLRKPYELDVVVQLVRELHAPSHEAQASL